MDALKREEQRRLEEILEGILSKEQAAILSKKMMGSLWKAQKCFGGRCR